MLEVLVVDDPPTPLDPPTDEADEAVLDALPVEADVETVATEELTADELDTDAVELDAIATELVPPPAELEVFAAELAVVVEPMELVAPELMEELETAATALDAAVDVADELAAMTELARAELLELEEAPVGPPPIPLEDEVLAAPPWALPPAPPTPLLLVEAHPKLTIAIHPMNMQRIRRG